MRSTARPNRADVRTRRSDVPQYLGMVAAVTLGLGTLVFPFAGLFFSHVTSACTGFAAFAVLWRVRRRRPSLRAVCLGGLLAGLAVTLEYSVAIVGVVLTAYVLGGRAAKIRRACAYLAGFGVGVLPLALYNQLAFGSVMHVSYADAVIRRGSSGHAEVGAYAHGFFGVGLPSPRVASSSCSARPACWC